MVTLFGSKTITIHMDWITDAWGWTGGDMAIRFSEQSVVVGTFPTTNRDNLKSMTFIEENGAAREIKGVDAAEAFRGIGIVRVRERGGKREIWRQVRRSELNWSEIIANTRTHLSEEIDLIYDRPLSVLIKATTDYTDYEETLSIVCLGSPATKALNFRDEMRGHWRSQLNYDLKCDEQPRVNCGGKRNTSERDRSSQSDSWNICWNNE